MADISFGNTVDVLKDAMAGAGLGHATIANNIANVNTPNYRRSEVSFKEALAATQGVPPDPNQLALVVDQPGHIPLNEGTAPVAFDPTAVVDENTQMRVDKSNVDVDQEMAKLSMNSAYAQTMSQLLTSQYTRLKLSMGN